MKQVIVLLALLLAGGVCGATPPGGGHVLYIPAYYDGQLFTINFTELPMGAQAALLAHNGSINFIYQSDPGLPGGEPFISVLDAIPGDGFNPLWNEVQITFNPGFVRRQLFSDTEIFAAVVAGEITLIPTEEVYTCAVVGPKKK
jgi:hypothetical protein